MRPDVMLEVEQDEVGSMWGRVPRLSDDVRVGFVCVGVTRYVPAPEGFEAHEVFDGSEANEEIPDETR
jgi:hypothetical protein